MTDLVGRKVRLTGAGYAKYMLAQSVRTVAVDDSRVDGTVGCRTGDGLLWTWLNDRDHEFAGVLLPKRVRIWVYSFAVPDSLSGFEWGPVDDDPIGAARLHALFDEEAANPIGYGALVEMHLALDGAANMTDYIDGELQDAIALGLVGKIIGRY